MWELSEEKGIQYKYGRKYDESLDLAMNVRH